MPENWRTAMQAALYGPAGFFVAGAGPGAHFRTSAHTGDPFAAALLRLLDRLDAALDRPDPLDLVDIGAGRGELLAAVSRLAPPPLARRLRLTAVELAARPPSLPDVIRWRDTPPDATTGLLVATEWLDNVPLDVAVAAPDASGPGWRQVLVEPVTGDETFGGAVDEAAARWLTSWWPMPDRDPAGADQRAEVGLPRDAAWSAAVAGVRRGAALAVDYGHRLADRPPYGTLTGYRDGRQVAPVPDGSCDLTAHVAIDSVAAAGSAVAGRPYTLVRQRDALRALGVDGARPPLELARTDPAGYVRALAAASTAAELTDPGGLGAHWWLLQPVDIEPDRWLPQPVDIEPDRWLPQPVDVEPDRIVARWRT